MKDKPASDAPAVQGAAFPVVGIGTSAGGLEALSQLLRTLPRDTGLGFVPGLHTIRISAEGLQAFSRTLGLKEEVAPEPKAK